MIYHIVTYGEQAYMVPDVWWRQICALQEIPFDAVNELFQQVDWTGLPAMSACDTDYSRGVTEVVEDFLQDMGISWEK